MDTGLLVFVSGKQNRIFLLFLTHAMLVHDNAFLYGTIMY
jgi:hypothetical protein